jgi:putative hydrolases of HD superfamily
MNKTYPPVQRIAELQQFIADFARIERVPHLADTGRRENDVEHSYGLALTCWYLAPKIAPELSLEKIFAYAIAHDTVELHAGDTFVFADSEKVATKSDREDEAIEQLQKDWPDFPEMVAAAKGYKNKVDEEAKFVKAVDKLLPVLMVNLGEKDAFWHRHKITLEMEIENKHTIEVSDVMAPYYDMIIDWLQNPNYMYKGN